MIAILFFLTLSGVQEPDAYFINPMVSFNGIVVTDNHCATLYFVKNNKLNELISAPSCGRYYSLSPDRKIIGLKLINQDGLQIPAVYDLATHTLTKLHAIVPQVGQVSFSNDGKVAFTIGEVLIVKDGSRIRRYNLGVYSNLAPISPDGKYVVYNDNEDQLWILDLETEARWCISKEDNFGYLNPKWSPDSRCIVYSSLDGRIEIYGLIEGKTCKIGGGREPDWSSDGQYIVYHKLEIDGHELIGSDLYLARYDGSGKIQLTKTTDVFEMEPKFFDHGHKIIYHTYHRREICAGKIVDNELQETEMLFSNIEPLEINHYEIKSDFGSRDSIDVPYLHQVYDTPDWFNGHWACAPTTAMMTIAYYRKLPYWDCWCSSPYGHTSQFGRYICERYHYREVDYNWQAQDPSGSWAMGGYGYMWSGTNRPRTHMVPYLANHKLNSWRDTTPTWNETIAEVNAGYPYCMCVGLTASGHLVLAVGQVLDWHTLIFNDPYGNKNTPGYPSYDGKYVRYDWPGYNNGYENLNNVYWCAGARGDWEPATDTIVDDLQFEDGFYLHTTPPSSMVYWRDASIGYRGHMWWTYTTAAIEDTCYAIWTPSLLQNGNYEVYAYIPGNHSWASVAKYKVHYAGGSQIVIINQANYSEQWVSLGIYPFDINGGYVYLGDATGTQGQRIGFDAMRWSYRGSGVEESNVFLSGVSVVLMSNPVKTCMLLSVYLDSEKDVGIALFDAAGRCVYEETKGTLDSGSHQIQIKSLRFPAGVYILRTSVGTENIFNKCIILR